MSGTKWASRAWTSQELNLSPRSLVFLDNHFEWYCNCAEWFEEHDFEHPDLLFSWGYHMDNSKSTLDIHNYYNLIGEYTGRELTFESDIIDAFAGITAAIPDEFFWGVPYSRFGEYLAWTVDRPPWDFKNFEIDQRQNCCLQIPNWSWFGWKGVISRANDMKPTKSLLAVYRWQEGHLQQICTPEILTLPRSGNGEDEAHYPTVWHDDAEWTVSLDDVPADVVPNENQIIF
ncbi:hypothetical protein CC86DRAFT_403403 [Ophiobolus disseminans]|uniref:Heterokaryon incompatibility domain-containing protein n=1 Tax=Ophiobolus disseminans TaxID=1469910 RepID=A0A6A7A9V5_9PLEO|nr:hypothetical protein CC86DRAFT_403403 [Ophiobolus disseminans]